MVIIWHHEPDEFIKKIVKENKVFYIGLGLKESDKESQYRIIYHCYNCNRSYSRNLKKYVEESQFEYSYKEIDDLIDELAIDIINDLDTKTIKELRKKTEYSHFGFGLYIRNNYIYNNDKIKYMVEPDDFSSEIYDRIIEKLSK